jgi:para-nitrobenzyl esterase
MLDYWTSFARSGKPQAANQPDWPIYGSDAAYMDFTDMPHPEKNLMPGMYALHEEAVCRRKTAGGIAWNWNTGLASPDLGEMPCTK